MKSTAVHLPYNDFIILGPRLARGQHVLEAVHALYFLPERYKLVFTGAEPVEQTFYDEVVALVERDELEQRVQFSATATSPDVVIITNPALAARMPNAVCGDTPEGLASAILDLARSF